MKRPFFVGGVAVAAVFAACSPSVSAASQQDVDVAAYVWPAYQPDPRWTELGIFGKGKGEWQNVWEAVPKWKGHRQPLVPTWGYENEADPKVVEKKIDAAVSHGVNVFIYDWYWYGGRPFLEDGLDKGFLGAKNNAKMKFFVMWANHHVNWLWDNTAADKRWGSPRKDWLGYVTDEEFRTKLVPRWIKRYFTRPNYYRIGGKPVFMIYEVGTFVKGVGGVEKAAAALDYFRAEAKKAGLGGIHLMACDYGLTRETVKALAIDSATIYNFIHWVNAGGNPDYADWTAKASERFDAAKRELGLAAYFPHASAGWDTNPRYPLASVQPTVLNSTPAKFETALRRAKAWSEKNTPPGMPRLVTVNSWNEWTEGSYLEPDTDNGFGYLDAVKRVFTKAEWVNAGSNTGLFGYDWAFAGVNGLNLAGGPQSMRRDFAKLKAHRGEIADGAHVLFVLCPFTSVLPESYDRRPSATTNPLLAFDGQPAASALEPFRDALVRGWKAEFSIRDFDDPMTAANRAAYVKMVAFAREAVSWCRAEKLKPVFVFPPAAPCFDGVFSDRFIKLYVTDFVRDVGGDVPFLNYWKHPDFRDSALFVNALFLNRKGRARLTARTLSDVRSAFGTARPARQFNACRPLPLGAITARGWLKEQLARNRDGLGGHLDELEPQMMGTPYTTRESYARWGASTPGWGAEISGNYWQGLVALAWTLDDPGLKAKATRWVEAVLRNAEPGGYLGTYKPTDNRHDDYNSSNTCGYLALLDFAEATGRQDVFDAVHRALLWFCENWAGDRKTRYAGGQLTVPMMRVYARTGDRRLLDFTLDYQRFLKQKDLFQSSARALGGADFEYNSNHAVAYANWFSMPAVIFGGTGDRRYLEASFTGYEKLRRHALLPTGGVSGNDEYLCAPRSNAESEYCGFAGLSESYATLLAVTGDTRWGDYMEETVFNAAQGARKKDEKALQYFSSPNMAHATEHSSHCHFDDNLFGPVHPVACCAARFVQVMPCFTRSLAFASADGALVLAAYAPCAIRFAGAVLECETRYPFDGKLRYTVRTAKPVTFAVRPKKPYWCDAMRVAVNGAEGAPTARTWKDGDTLDVTLELKPVVSRFDDKSAVQPLVVRRGALVFSLPIREKWENLGNGIAGSLNAYAPTPLPKGWAWWRVKPVMDEKPVPLYEWQGYVREMITWNIALDEKKIAIRVEDTHAKGYVWENPPVKLHLTGYKAPFAFPPYPQKTTDFQVPVQTVTRPVDVALVPYGCTALRITCFPRCDSSRLRPDLSFRP